MIIIIALKFKVIFCPPLKSSDSKEPSPFKKELDEDLYMKILNCLSVFHYDDSIIIMNEDEREQTREFYKKFKRNFFIKKNTKNPKFVFHESVQEIKTFDDGIPIIGVNLHHRKTNTTEYKILVFSVFNRQH